MSLPKITQDVETIKANYYTTSGGYLINGSAIWMANDDVWKSLDFHSPEGGAGLHLRGGNSPSQPYSFVLSTSTGDVNHQKMLFGDNTGTLQWNGKNILTSAGGTITGDLNINGNITVSNNVKGARFVADNNYNNNIDFIFRHVTNGGAFLNGDHACNDEWHIISTLKSWWHGETSGHRTYPDGFIEQWGRYYLNGMYKDTDNTISFVVSFTTTNYTLITQANRTNNATTLINNQCFVNNRTTTNFRARCYGDGVSEYVDWYACGY